MSSLSDPSSGVLAANRFAAVAGVDRWLADEAAAAWRQLDPADLQGGFANSFLPRVVPAVTQAQTVAAQAAVESMSRMIDQAGAGSAATDAPRVVPGAFAGVMPGGGDLIEGLRAPLIGTYVDLAADVPTDVALDHGLQSMDRILTTVVHDTARTAEQVEMVSRRVTYFIRGVEPGACGPCILLSGRHYKVNEGFDRHDGCRCFHLPGVSVYGPDGSVEHQDVPGPYRIDEIRSPNEIFDSLSDAEQDAAFGVANARAIRAGADIGRVLNAAVKKKGMAPVTSYIRDPRTGARLKVTSNMARKGPRLTPQAIYKLAGNDQAKAIRLLKLHNYLR